MPRGLIFLLLIILLLVAGIYFLSQSADEVPVQTIESDVTANAAAN
jgi:Na+-transporting methylmalonyl-CoA/oxaloacetate decarboxylase gamma subunit